MSQTFIIDGVGHDLYPRSWKRIEDMAELNDDFTFGLSDAKILYCRNEEDKKKFVSMQEKLKANFADRDFMFKKALEKLDIAMELYRTMMFEDALYKVRMASGYIARYLSIAIACINGTNFKQRLDLETVELAKMELLPESFIAYYNAIVKAESIEELKGLSHLIISCVRNFISLNKPQKFEAVKQPIYEDLASWYQEMSLTWRRIYIHCDEQNFERVFADAVKLQDELCTIKHEFALNEMDLIGSYNVKDLSELKNRAKELESYIITEIEIHGVAINKYDTVEEFLRKNS